MRSSLVVLASILNVGLALAVPVRPVPLVLNHQGRLLDSADNGVSGLVSIKFTLYKDFQTPRTEPDTVYWTETRQVTVVKGTYQVGLGDVPSGGTALTLEVLGDGTGERWLGITVGTEAELTPRLQIGSVPFAFRAARATAADRADLATTAEVAKALACEGCVTAAMIAPGAVSADVIAAGSITAAQLGAGAVGAEALATGAVGTDALAEGAVIAGKIAEGAIGTTKIVAGAINTTRLADGAVTTDKLADGAVTTAKLADGAVSTAKLATGSVTAEKIPVGGLTLDRLAGRDAATGLVTGLNAERLGGKTAADVAAMADPSAAIATALRQFSGVERTCNSGAGYQVFDGAAWGTCQARGWNCAIVPTHAGCVSGSAYKDCAAIRSDPDYIPQDGTHWIDVDGLSGSTPPQQVYCDMVTGGGGWTLVFSSQTVAGTADRSGAWDAKVATKAPSGSMLSVWTPFSAVSKTRFACDGGKNGSLDYDFTDTAGEGYAKLRSVTTGLENWTVTMGGGTQLNNSNEDAGHPDFWVNASTVQWGSYDDVPYNTPTNDDTCAGTSYRTRVGTVDASSVSNAYFYIYVR